MTRCGLAGTSTGPLSDWYVIVPASAEADAEGDGEADSEGAAEDGWADGLALLPLSALPPQAARMSKSAKVNGMNTFFME